jgi:L-fuconolactonase
VSGTGPDDRGVTSELIDTHLHIWDLERGDYPWLGPESGILYRTYAVGEVDASRRDAGVDGAILVQAANNRRDTDLMLESMAGHPWILGVVGWVDLMGAAGTLATAAELKSTGRVVGIRHLIHNEPDPDWIVQPAVLDGLRALAEVGLPYDVVSVLPRHLAHVATVAQAVPELRLVIDHLSKPPIASGDLREWRQLFAAAAEHPNVSAKVSGLDTAARPGSWTVDDLRPAFDHALETLGPERLMYGGDWPVSILGGGYARQHAAFTALIAELSLDEQQAIKSGTAIRVYGLGGRSSSVSTGSDQ